MAQEEDLSQFSATEEDLSSFSATPEDIGQEEDLSQFSAKDEDLSSFSASPEKVEQPKAFDINKFDITKSLAEAINPYQKWYAPYQNEQLDIDIDESETNKRIEEYRKTARAIEGPLGEIKAGLNIAAGYTVKPLGAGIIGALQIPARAGGGLAYRTLEASKYETPEEIIKNFLSPPGIVKQRKELEQSGVYDNLWYGWVPGYEQLIRLGAEVFPLEDAYGMMDEKDQAFFDGIFEGAKTGYTGEAGGETDLSKFFGRMSVSLATDPLTTASFGVTKIPQMARGASLAEDVAIGRKSLLELRLPFAEKPFFEYSNVAAAEHIDEIAASIQAKYGVKFNLRNFSQATGFQAADDAILDRNISIGENLFNSKKYQEQIKAFGGYDETVSALSGMMAEHGDDYGVLLAQKKGLKFSKNEIEKAKQLNALYAQVNEEGNKILKDAGGIDLSEIEFEAPSIEDQQKYENYLKETKGLDVPRVTVVDKNGKTIDLTYSSRYDYGRALKEDVKKAREINDAVRMNDEAFKSNGIPKVRSSKSRNRLSTEAMEALMEKQGVKGGAYRIDRPNIILENYLEKAQAAADLKAINGLADKYAVLPGMEQNAINAARSRVMESRLTGVPPSREDLIISKLTPEDFIAPNIKGFDKHKFMGKADDAVILKLQTRVMPKPIALKVDQVMLPKHISKNKLQASTEWWQKQWAKNVLTNPFRLGPQAIDNLGRIAAIDAIPQALMQMNPFRKKDYIDEMMEAIPSVSSQTAWSLKDFDGPMRISTKMVKDPEANNVLYHYLGSIWDTIKSGKDIFSIQGLKKIGKGLAEFPNENKVANFMREVGNSADIVTRKAAFRKFINQGYSKKDAVRLVNEYLMDFENTTQATKALRYVSPFASFHLKNIETIPKLLAAKPVLANVLRPEDGYFVKAWNDATKWTPDDYRLLTKLFPYYRSQYLGPVLRGQKELINNHSSLVPLIKQWVDAGLTPEQKEKTSGMIMSFNLPNFYQTGLDFADLSSSLSSPVSQFLVNAAGYNSFTGEKIAEDQRESLRKAFAAVNPYQYPKIYNKVVLPLYNKIAPEQAKALRQGWLSADLEKVFKLEFGKSAVDRMKIDENTISELTNMKFLGLARVDVHDMSYYMHQMALIKTMNKLVSNYGGAGSLVDKAAKGDREDVLRVIARLKNISSDIEFNTKAYEDFIARKEIVYRELSPDEREVLSKEVVIDENATPTEGIEVPPDDGSQFDFEEVPPLSYMMPQGRSPASSNEMFNRAGDITRKYLMPESKQNESIRVPEIKARPEITEPVSAPDIGPYENISKGEYEFMMREAEKQAEEGTTPLELIPNPAIQNQQEEEPQTEYIPLPEKRGPASEAQMSVKGGRTTISEGEQPIPGLSDIWSMAGQERSAPVEQKMRQKIPDDILLRSQQREWQQNQPSLEQIQLQDLIQQGIRRGELPQEIYKKMMEDVEKQRANIASRETSQGRSPASENKLASEVKEYLDSLPKEDRDKALEKFINKMNNKKKSKKEIGARR